MELSHAQLKAFSEISRLGSFTKAADTLAVTQSALSHRIRLLEEELGTSVFIRVGHRVRLTETGQRLLQYCHVQNQAEEELLQDLRPGTKRSSKLAGRIRVGGVSTMMRSLVMPVVSDLVRKNPDVQVDFLVKEVSDLKAALSNGEVDFVISTEHIELPGTMAEPVGSEENVLVQSAAHAACPDIYLDHDSNDMTTYSFFKHQGRKEQRLMRSFFDDVYGLMDAAAAGLGKAVLPVHMLKGDRRFNVLGGFKPLLIPVHVYRFEQPFYTRLNDSFFKALVDELKMALKQK